MADAAMATLQSSYEAVKKDAEQYLPEQADLIDEAIAKVKRTIEQGEYRRAAREAQELTGKVSELGAVLGAKKAALVKAWDGVAASLPGAVDSLQTKIDELSKTTQLPAGVTKEAVEAARAAMPALTALWEEAKAAFASADLSGALAKAQAARAKAVEILAALGLPVPESLASPEPPDRSARSPGR